MHTIHSLVIKRVYISCTHIKKTTKININMTSSSLSSPQDRTDRIHITHAVFLCVFICVLASLAHRVYCL